MELSKAMLHVGISSFNTIVENNCIYVDKTDLIVSFARTKSFYFLSRPRRFGKSTLVAHKETEIEEKINEAAEQIKDRKYDNILRKQTIMPLAMVLLDKKVEGYKGSIHEIAKILEIEN